MNEDLKAEITKLKHEKHATILVHNYVEADVQDIADFIGDSLELSRKAKENQAEIIIFCGVRFMGETAKLLSPKARVIMPAANAGCPMAEMCQAEALRAWKAANPEAYIVAYVNTTAATKALVDICVTSGNAERIVTKLDMKRPVMFLPDQNLGANLNRKLGLNMMLWNGYCHTHNRISPDDIRQAKAQHPDSSVLVHLECKPEVVELADAALSTAGMLTFVQKSNAKSFIIGTEEGMIYRLETLFPDRQFYGLNHPILCPNMKRITLPLVRDALLGKGLEIQLSDEIMTKAVLPIERMLEMS